jgi:hypothetical protein
MKSEFKGKRKVNWKKKNSVHRIMKLHKIDQYFSTEKGNGWM